LDALPIRISWEELNWAIFVSKLKKPISFETTFGTYVVDELLGEGGAGHVYGGLGI
jgi:hypothetical protein